MITCTSARSRQTTRTFSSHNAIADALEFIRTSLERLSLGTNETNRAQLMAEEALVRLSEHGNSTTIQVSIRHFLGRVKIQLTVPGKEFDFAKSLELCVTFDNEELLPDTAAAISNILLRSFENRIKYRHRRDCNHIIVMAVKPPFPSLYWTLEALVLAVFTGLLLKIFASQALCDLLNEEIFSPIVTVFMNGLKFCAVPVVFLSIASCIAQFGDMSEIKRISVSLLICFAIMQCISAIAGIAIACLFRSVHSIEIASSVSHGASMMAGSTLSFMDILLHLMPSNIIRPFLEADVLQLIVLAAFTGIAAGSLGAGTVRNLLEEFSAIFMKITGTLMRFTPLMVFCSIVSMFLMTGLSVLLPLFGLLAMILAGYALLLVVYAVITAFKCRLTPLRLFAKSLPMMLTAFSTSSSIAAFPDSMRAAEELGISQKVCSLSIPLGAFINQNGTCIFVVVSGFFMAGVYGLDVPVSLMFPMAFSAAALTMGAASVPGFGIIVLSMFMSKLGGPIEAVGLVMGIFSVIDMFVTVVNCMGNMTASLVTADSLRLLDEKVYRSCVDLKGEN